MTASGAVSCCGHSEAGGVRTGIRPKKTGTNARNRRPAGSAPRPGAGSREPLERRAGGHARAKADTAGSASPGNSDGGRLVSSARAVFHLCLSHSKNRATCERQMTPRPTVSDGRGNIEAPLPFAGYVQTEAHPCRVSTNRRRKRLRLHRCPPCLSRRPDPTGGRQGTADGAGSVCRTADGQEAQHFGATASWRGTTTDRPNPGRFRAVGRHSGLQCGRLLGRVSLFPAP